MCDCVNVEDDKKKLQKKPSGNKKRTCLDCNIAEQREDKRDEILERRGSEDGGGE